jgi:hypothetical protein
MTTQNPFEACYGEQKNKCFVLFLCMIVIIANNLFRQDQIKKANTRIVMEKLLCIRLAKRVI